MLTSLVVREKDDVSLGFEGYDWHTHGSILAALAGLPVEDAVNRFVDALLSNQSVIAAATREGTTIEVWVAGTPIKADCYKPENELVTFRLWDGTAIDPEDLALKPR